jgi:ectoine hydroxylase-related dioxygenase (phytanoyl-CoA dioxygenase family)
MSADEQRKQFEEKGFAVFGGVLSADEVTRLRTSLEALFAQPPEHPGDRQEIRNDIYSRYPDLRSLLGHPRILEALRTVLGDELFSVPEMAAHDSGFGGWHKDTASLDIAGKTFHREPDFRMVQMAIYLQPNSEYGGGLDILPGSQKDPPPGENGGLLRRAKNLLGGRRPYTIPNAAGDMVMFDMRCDHRATPPTAGDPDSLPAEHRKFAIFSVWSSKREHADKYREHIASRKGYDYLKGHSYPDEVQQIARENEFSLA